ncbi:MAG: DUF5931 domain-containing protein [Pseudonocardiaceae bacterium]
MPVTTDILTPLWRTVVVLRIITATVAIGSIIVAHDGFARPDLGWLVLAGIVVWTLVTCLAYSYDVSRRIHVIALDLLVTLALLASSVLVLSAEQLSAHTPLLAAIWSSGPVLAAGVHAGRIAGVLFGVAVCLTEVWARGVLTTNLVGEMVLLVGAGFVFGLAGTTARRATEQLRRAARTEAAAAERERLLTAAIPGPVDSAGSDDEDLASALRLLASSRVDVAVPATEIPLPASDVEELVAVAREVLAGTAHPDAKAWVLVEDLGEEVVLTVRDEAGSPTGMTRTIRGRVADLGATLTLDTGPGQGTEWEVRLARATVDE